MLQLIYFHKREYEHVCYLRACITTINAEYIRLKQRH